MGRTKRYKRFSPQFKREALRRASEDGATDAAVSSPQRTPQGPIVVEHHEGQRHSQFGLGDSQPGLLSEILVPRVR